MGNGQKILDGLAMANEHARMTAELSAMTARAEAAERERDKLRKILDAYEAAGVVIEGLDGDLEQTDVDSFLAARGK